MLVLLALVTLLPGQPVPPLSPGSELVLAPGVHRSLEIQGQDITVRAAPGAVVDAGGKGHGLVVEGKRIRLTGLTVRNTGPNYDFYNPDSAVYFVNCQGCVLEGLRARGVVTAVRAEASPGLVVRGVRAVGNRQGPGITLYQCPRARVEQNRLDGFLDNLYVERSDGAVIRRNELVHSFRYGLHLMFSKDVEVDHNHAYRGRVGSAVMYGRRVYLHDNVFEDHVGPLAFGLLSQEQHESRFVRNVLRGNNVGILIVSAVDDLFEDNTIERNGFGVLVLREKNKVSSAARFTGNRFLANVYDLAVDDPKARVELEGNAYDRASRLDLDGDGIADIPYLPSSSYALLASRELDLSLFAFSPGVTLWEEAEKKVPGLRLMTLADPEPRILRVPPGRPALLPLLIAGGVLLGGLWLRS